MLLSLVCYRHHDVSRRVQRLASCTVVPLEIAEINHFVADILVIDSKKPYFQQITTRPGYFDIQTLDFTPPSVMNGTCALLWRDDIYRPRQARSVLLRIWLFWGSHRF